MESRTRSLTIGSRIRDLTDDYYLVKKETGNLKFIKHEMLPPLTVSYMQNRAIREVHVMHKLMTNELEKCDQKDIDKRNILNEVTKKCEALKAAFENSEGAFIQLQKQKETHRKVMESITDEIKNSTREIRRFVKSAENLAAIRDVMQDIIKENTCYVDFLERVAAESNRFKSAREITNRYEKLMAVKRILTQRLDEAIERMQESKKDVLQYNFDAHNQQQYALERLQAVDYELNQVKSKTIKYEMALNNICNESLDHMRTMNLVLKSAEQMIENLIKEKRVPHTYRKKPLAAQFEAVRKAYIKKKAILREYQRGMDKLKWKKSNRVSIFDGYEKTLVQKLTAKTRLDDLLRKKKISGWRKQEADYLKRLKRTRGSKLLEESDEEFDFRNEPGAVFYEDEPESPTQEDKDDWEDDDLDDDDFDELHRFGSVKSRFTILQEDSMKTEFMPTSVEDANRDLKSSSSLSSSVISSDIQSVTTSGVSIPVLLGKVKFA